MKEFPKFLLKCSCTFFYIFKNLLAVDSTNYNARLERLASQSQRVAERKMLAYFDLR